LNDVPVLKTSINTLFKKPDVSSIINQSVQTTYIKMTSG